LCRYGKPDPVRRKTRVAVSAGLHTLTREAGRGRAPGCGMAGDGPAAGAKQPGWFFLQEIDRVDRGAVFVYFEMHVGTGGIAGFPYPPQFLTLTYALALVNHDA